ncbi:MAG: hypothetical protein ACOZQL_03595 [Myxococcota bacterium]
MKTRALSIALPLFIAACAEAPRETGTLLENHGPTASRVQGLLRSGEGPYVKGQVESLRALYDAAHVKSVAWSASAGALSARGERVTWTLPAADTAELTLTLTLDDGAEVVTPFGFSLVERAENPRVARSASEALLATPMPVLDGGVAEISGGACEVEYDSGANVHLAFTTGTHPAVYYGRWNGSAWTLEVMDAMGFNTGGLVGPTMVRLRVDASNNPHILYLRDSQLWYATKSGSTWTRERVDSATNPLYSTDSDSSFLALNAMGRPTVGYQTYPSYSRQVLATRTAPNTWTATLPTYSIAGTNYTVRGRGDLMFDAAGTLYFPVYVSGSTTSASYLGSWNGTATDARAVATNASGWDLAAASGVWAGANRLLYRTAAGVYDFALATPLANATYTWSPNEQSGAGEGDLAWNGRPVVLHHHSGGSLELVTPLATGSSFWTWTQLGSSSGVTASVAVHPTTGVPSICYQANNRVMFQ